MKTSVVKFQCNSSQTMKNIAFLIQTASQFDAKITLSLGEKRANMKSLLGVMSLGLENNVDLKIECDGHDEEKALATLLSCFSGSSLS